MTEILDQMGNQVSIPEIPQRIVSLVPSQTELLYDLGLEDKVVGITRFCVHPGHWRSEKTVVGGTKAFRKNVVKQLLPDLIIGNKEENDRESIESLQKDFPVWMSDISNFEDSLDMIQSLGGINGKGPEAKNICESLKTSFSNISPLEPKMRVLYLIWRNPWIAVSKDTFIDDMLLRCGFENVLHEMGRYPELDVSYMEGLNPEVVLLSSEPYPFKSKHIAELVKIFPSARFELVDGEMFSWYGSRLLKSPKYFRNLLEKLKN